MVVFCQTHIKIMKIAAAAAAGVAVEEEAQHSTTHVASKAEQRLCTVQ